MHFNKTSILALVACTATAFAPLQAQAISVASYNEPTFTESSKWDKFINDKTTTYVSPIAMVRGQASWYGPGFYGNQTANGEIYRPGTMTAAHRSLPFGTMVRVTNRLNGRTAVVRINDRGPYVGGRILDLGEGAASYLGVKSSGVVPISLEVLN